MTSFLSISINLFLVGWMLSCFNGVLVRATAPYVPAMYVFGDSLADAGTNSFIPRSTVKANFPPYGVSYFPYPTGRFTNGRTAFDILATSFLGLPRFPPPFLDSKANFSTGINFASGGSGLLDSTGDEEIIISMSTQIQQFEYLMRENQIYKYIGSKNPKSFLASSLYCIAIGGNDVSNYLSNSTFQNTTTPEQFITLLLANLNSYITRLYRIGGRKFLVFDIPTIGCTPISRLLSGNGECLAAANQLAVAYNKALKSLIDQINQLLEGLSVVLLNSFDYVVDMIQHGEAYGLSETNSACCGSGAFNAEVSCGKTTPPALFCNNTDSYLFWDANHPTEKIYSIFSKEIWSGNSSIMYPFNLSTLILGESIYGHY